MCICTFDWEFLPPIYFQHIFPSYRWTKNRCETKLFNSFLSNDYFNVNKLLCLGTFGMGHNFMQMKLCKKEVKGGGKITLHAVLYIYFESEWDLYLCVCRSSVEKMLCLVRSRSAVTPGITCWSPKPCTRTPQLKPVIFIITFRWLHESSNYKQRICISHVYMRKILWIFLLINHIFFFKI